MPGLPTISRGISYGPLSTISRGYLVDGDTPEPEPGDLGGWFCRIVLSLELKL
jgi:hypothetical protein